MGIDINPLKIPYYFQQEWSFPPIVPCLICSMGIPVVLLRVDHRETGIFTFSNSIPQSRSSAFCI